MFTFSKTSTKPNFLFGLLPNYFKENDAYKDSNSEGTLERFLSIFCNEIDVEVKPFLEGTGILFHADSYDSLPTADKSKFLIHLSDTLGNPPDIFNSEVKYRALLSNIFEIYKYKGSRRSLDNFLALMDWVIIDYFEIPGSGNNYDMDLQYDGGCIIYDTSCVSFSRYSITITDTNGTIIKTPTVEELERLREVIENFIQPVNAILMELRVEGGEVSYYADSTFITADDTLITADNT